MKKNLLVLPLILFMLSGCGVPATPVPESTKTMAPAPSSAPLSTATLLPSETPQSATPYTDPSIPNSEQIVYYYFVTSAENPLPEGSVVILPDTYILAPTFSDLTYSPDTATDVRTAVEAALDDDRNGWISSNVEIVNVTFRDGFADVILQGEYFGVGDVTLITASMQILMTVFANASVQTASVSLNGDTIGNSGISISLDAKPAYYVFTRDEIEKYMNEHADGLP